MATTLLTSCPVQAFFQRECSAGFGIIQPISFGPIATTLLTSSSYSVDVDGVQEFVTRMFFHCGGETYFPPPIHLPVALFMHVTVPCGSMHPLPIHWNLN